jgi:beta-glucosidase/6-phospho-beta-glucosidase/beta-galactosidase
MEATMASRASRLEHLIRDDAFWWATGIEDTFITAPWPATGRTLDEYELTGHYERWEEDLALMASLGVRAARYGIPWHRTQPEANTWDWEWADRTLERLLETGIEPIVDLVHYGLPPWLDGAYLHPDFPARMAEYAARLAERFRGRIHWYTPLNEPRITAWYCGKLGWWPPFRRGWRGFVEVMLGVCRGIVASARALESVDTEIVPVHVDATDLYATDDPSLLPEVERRQEIVFLALDLVSGRLDREHPLWPWLLQCGAREEDLAWFLQAPIDLPVVGMNLYPMFTQKRLARTPRGLRVSMPYAQADLVERLGQLYWNRYQRPLMITETASFGSVRRRQRWLDASIAAVRKLRGDGVPLVGYTWWPMFALVAWAYRQGTRDVSQYLIQMGLWDLDPDPSTRLRRVHTPLVDAYRELVGGGAAAVGPLTVAGRKGGLTA